MHRTQLLLETWQYTELRARADSEGKSLSALVREALTAYLDSERGPGLLERIEGIAEGPADLAESHDKYLYGEGE